MKAKKVNTLHSTSQLKNLIKEYDLITIIKKFCEEVSTSMCPRGITFKTFYSTHPIEGFARGVTGRLSKNSLQDGANFSKLFSYRSIIGNRIAISGREMNATRSTTNVYVSL
jgi:hypothetical protein